MKIKTKPITKRRLINLVRKHTYKNKRTNLVGLFTLEKLQDDKVKIKMMADYFPSKVSTRLRDQYYNNTAYVEDYNSIVFNEENEDICNNDESLAELCVHEVNHLYNYGLWKQEIINYKANEFLAHVATYMFKYNRVILTRSDIKFIENEVNDRFNDEEHKFLDQPFDKFETYKLGKFY